MDRLRSVAIVIRQLIRRTGAFRQACEQIRLFRGLGAQVDVYSDLINEQIVRENGGIPRALSGWPLVGYWRRRLFNARALRRLRKHDHDLVIGHGDIVEQDVLCLHNCIHLAHELIHGRPTPANHVVGRIHAEVLGRKGFRLLVANSKLMARDIIARFDIEPGRVEVVYPGHDPAQFNSGERDARRPRLRLKLGVGPEEILIGLVTSGDFEKRNVAFFLRGLAKIPPTLRSQCHCLVVGKESQVGRYRSLATELGLGERVRFSGAVAHVQDVFHALDIYALPAKIEEFGRAVLEAMACGLPVVTSDRVGCSELFEGDNRAFVFPSGDEDEFVRRLGQLVEHPELRLELGEINRTVALQHTEQHEAQRFADLLRERGLIPPASAHIGQPFALTSLK